jgi:hypothetical protein
MKKLCIALLLACLASMHAADEEPERPGFLRRAFQGAKKGVGTVLDATKKAGEKAVDVVKSPFRKRGASDVPAAVAWRNLEMTMKILPADVRLPDTRFVEVSVLVINKGKEAVQLDFPSSLRIDVVLKDDAGKILSRWSDDQRIDREPAIVLVNPKERLEYSARISTRDMKPGSRFEVEAFFPSHEGLRTSRFVTPVR